MVKITIEEQEAKAYLQLLNDAKVPPEMGYILTSLKYKMLKAFEKEEEKKKEGK